MKLETIFSFLFLIGEVKKFVKFKPLRCCELWTPSSIVLILIQNSIPLFILNFTTLKSADLLILEHSYSPQCGFRRQRIITFVLKLATLVRTQRSSACKTNKGLLKTKMLTKWWVKVTCCWRRRQTAWHVTTT